MIVMCLVQWRNVIFASMLSRHVGHRVFSVHVLLPLIVDMLSLPQNESIVGCFHSHLMACECSRAPCMCMALARFVMVTNSLFALSSHMRRSFPQYKHNANVYSTLSWLLFHCFRSIKSIHIWIELWLFIFGNWAICSFQWMLRIIRQMMVNPLFQIIHRIKSIIQLIWRTNHRFDPSNH